MLKVLRLCVVAILRLVGHQVTSNIRLFCLCQTQGQIEKRGGVRGVKFLFLLLFSHELLK